MDPVFFWLDISSALSSVTGAVFFFVFLCDLHCSGHAVQSMRKTLFKRRVSRNVVFYIGSVFRLVLLSTSIKKVPPNFLF